MRLGTYTTFDCPTAHEGEAYAWLQSQFNEIGGSVRRVSNPHDFGMYPSFEIDIPEAYEFVDEDFEADDLESATLYDKKQVWIEVANEIEEQYSIKFGEWL